MQLSTTRRRVRRQSNTPADASAISGRKTCRSKSRVFEIIGLVRSFKLLGAEKPLGILRTTCAHRCTPPTILRASTTEYTASSPRAQLHTKRPAGVWREAGGASGDSTLASRRASHAASPPAPGSTSTISNASQIESRLVRSKGLWERVAG
ncbi:hypothetical protein L1887_55168 [Cichorium endivia]|nr:hypothetical protein L1887_55168 [Cichorium endivia]